MTQSGGFVAFSDTESDFKPFRSQPSRTKGIASRQTAEEEEISAQEARDAIAGIATEFYRRRDPEISGYERLFGEGLKRLLPGLEKGPQFERKRPEELEDLLGVKGEPVTSLGRGIKRTGLGALELGIFGPEAAAAGAFGGAAGQAVEEATGNKTAGDVAEILATLGKGARSLKFKGGRLSPRATEIIEPAKRLGYSDDVLEALVKTPKQIEILAGGTGSKRYINKFAEKAREEANNAYTEIYKSAFEMGAIPEVQRKALAKALNEKIQFIKRGPGVTSDEKKAVGFVQQAVRRFRKRGYYTDIIKANRKLNEEGQRLKSPHLEKFKEDFYNTLQEVNPQLAEEFDAFNQLYPGLLALEKAAIPKPRDPIKTAVHIGGGIGLLATGHPLLAAAEFIGPAAATRLKHFYFQSPKLQKYVRNLSDFVKQGKIKQADGVSRKINNELSAIEREEFLREEAVVQQERQAKKLRAAENRRKQRAKERAQHEAASQQELLEQKIKEADRVQHRSAMARNKPKSQRHKKQGPPKETKVSIGEELVKRIKPTK